MAVTKWSWEASNGDATEEQVKASYAALTNQGHTKDFSYKVWNDILEKIAEVRTEWGDAWDTHILSLTDAKMGSGSPMTADRFNCAVENIPLSGYIWPWRDDLGRKEIQKGDICYGKYFIWLTDGLNYWIGLERLPFTARDSFILQESVDVQQRSSKILVLSGTLKLADNMQMYVPNTQRLRNSRNMARMVHSFNLSVEQNALAFYSTANLFEYRTIRAGAETHIARNVGHSSCLVRGMGDGITQTYVAAHCLSITPSGITLLGNFEGDVKKAVCADFSGTLPAMEMSGVTDKAGIIVLSHTGVLGTGYTFNFSQDVNSGIGDYWDAIWLEENFTALLIKQATYKEHTGDIQEPGATAQLSDAPSGEADSYSGGIALVPDIELLKAAVRDISADAEIQSESVAGAAASPCRLLTAESESIVESYGQINSAEEMNVNAASESTVSTDGTVITARESGISAEAESMIGTSAAIRTSEEISIMAETSERVGTGAELATDDSFGVSGEVSILTESASKLNASDNVYVEAESGTEFIVTSELGVQADVEMDSSVETTVESESDAVVKQGAPVMAETDANFATGAELTAQDRVFIPDAILNAEFDEHAELDYNSGFGIEAEITAFDSSAGTADLFVMGQTSYVQAIVSVPICNSVDADLEVSKNKAMEADSFITVENNAPIVDMVEPIPLSGEGSCFTDEAEADVGYVPPKNAGTLQDSAPGISHTFVQTVGQMELVLASELEEELASSIDDKLVDNVERRIEIN